MLKSVFFRISKFKRPYYAPIAIRKIVDLITDSFLVINEEYEVIDYNKALIEMFDGHVTINRKDDFLDLIVRYFNISKSRFIKLNDYIINHQKPYSFGKHIKVGSLNKYFTIELTPILSKNIYLGTIVLLKDITQDKKDIIKLKHKQIEVSDRERLAYLGQLIDNITHSFYKPINIISKASNDVKEHAIKYKSYANNTGSHEKELTQTAKDIKNSIIEIESCCQYIIDILTIVKNETISKFNLRYIHNG